MSQGLTPITPEGFTAAVEHTLASRLASVLAQRSSGHCMRVADLDTEASRRLANRLRTEVPDALPVVLVSNDDRVEDPVSVTATKLVELRNPLPDGSLRPPLLVFVPNDVRASAEDSFGVATFESIPISDVYQEMAETAQAELPAPLRDAVAEVKDALREAAWPWTDAAAWARYYLTILDNECDPQVAGAALYELGLVPDFDLLKSPGAARTRIRLNTESVTRLTYSDGPERTRVLSLPLTDAGFRVRLAQHLGTLGLEDPRRWTRALVTDPSLWPYTFDKWPHEDAAEPAETVCIEVTKLELPRIEQGQAAGREDLFNQQVLTTGPNGLKSFAVEFEVTPPAIKVGGLVRFKANILAQDGTAVGLSQARAIQKGNKTRYRISIGRLAKVAWTEGWHFVRIMGYTEGGDPVPLVDASGQEVGWGGAHSPDAERRPNDSDLFYVLPGDDADVDPPQRAIPRRPSAAHTLVEFRARAIAAKRDPDEVAITDHAWLEQGRSGLSVAQLKFGRHGTVHVALSNILRHIELVTVEKGHLLSGWHVDITGEAAKEPTLLPIQYPADSEAWQSLVQARYEYLSEFVTAEGEAKTTETIDLDTIRPAAIRYAEAYAAVLREQAADPGGAGHALADSLRLDAVTVTVRSLRGGLRSAVILGPFHPMRALWLSVWAATGGSWLSRASHHPEYASLASKALLGLAPSAAPPVAVGPDGTLFLAAESLHPFWTLYASPAEHDPQGLVGIVSRALGLGTSDSAGGADGAVLADRLRHYLRQHPYVRTLTINAFNPGRGAYLASALVELQKDGALKDLHYDVRLFGPEPTAPHFGDAFDDLSDPAGRTSTREVDAFASYGGDHRRPKLSVARVLSTSFHEAPELYEAHVSMLFDVFPPGPVVVASAPPDEVAPVHGLVPAARTRYTDDDESVAWERTHTCGEPVGLPGHPGLAEALAAASRAVVQASATLAGGGRGVASEDWRTAVRLQLGVQDRALLHRVHDVSDWVVTLDRTLGVEFFDHGGLRQRPDFLVDYSPAARQSGHRHVVVSSRADDEVHSVIAAALAERELPADRAATTAIFNAVRALSPRLSLKLVAQPAHRAEALGLALARLFLERQGATANQVVVPLDDHLDLYGEAAEAADARGEAPSFQRTDLALFDLQAADRLITCNLVEVKAYANARDYGALVALKARIAEQVVQSEATLQLHFDPLRVAPDRPDRPLKAHQFREMLGYYLERAARLGDFDADAAEEARVLLSALESGYTLAFSRTGVIFDFGDSGSGFSEHEGGIEYHRLGRDLIATLLSEATEASIERKSSGRAPAPRNETTVPLLDSASFLARSRDRMRSAATLRGESLAGVVPDPTGAVQVSTLTPDPRDSSSRQADDLTDPTLHRQVPPANPVGPPVPIQEPTRTETARTETARTETAHLPASSPASTELSAPEADASTATESQSAATPVAPPSTADVPDPPASAEPPNADPLVESPVSSERGFEPRPDYAVMLGVNGSSNQYGILGEASGRKVALDLDHTHTISLFGVQGGGKSYTLGTVIEMAALRIPHINFLPQPLATVLFHYSPTQDYRPEFTTVVEPNSEQAQLATLRARYGADPQALSDVHLLVPLDKLAERRAEYPGLNVHPLLFSPGELQASHWRFLMGAVGNQSAYIRQINLIMRRLRNELTVEKLRAAVEEELPDSIQSRAQSRLDFAATYIGAGEGVRSLVRPGRLLIVDLRDEFIEKDEALGLFVVLLQLISDAQSEAGTFNKLVVFDEAHKYTENADLVAGLVEVVREMRHKGTSILVASQDPPSVPTALIELSSHIILHKFNSPSWLRHIQKANAALANLTAEGMAALAPGEAYVWASKASDPYFSRSAVKITCRPRVTQHGGATKTAT